MWLDWLVFCEYGFSVSALWCPLTTLTILLGFLLPWTWGVSLQLLQQIAATAPYLGQGISPHSHPYWPWTWSSSSRPSCACTATAPWMWGSSSRPLPPGLQCGVAPPGCHPWPQMWGSSSLWLLRCCSLAVSSAALDLGHGVAPLGHASVRSMAAIINGL